MKPLYQEDVYGEFNNDWAFTRYHEIQCGIELIHRMITLIICPNILVWWN